MKNEVCISIILPCYNVGDYIQRAYESISSQSFEKWEAIFVDDGSTDNTSKKLSEISKNDSRVQIIRQKNSGRGITRNNGAELAKGKYLYFMDPDDEIEKDALNILYQNSEQTNSEITISGYTEIDIVNKNEKKFNVAEREIFKSNSAVKKVYPRLMNNKLFNPPWNKLYLRKFWIDNNLQFPDVKIGQDALLNLLAFRYVNKLTLITDEVYKYYIGRSGSAQTVLSDIDFKYFDINQKYERDLFKHWGITDEDYFLGKKISFCFADSVKVFRFIKSNNQGYKEFVSLWNKRQTKEKSRNIRILKNKIDKVNFIKLIALKFPRLNYIIQKRIVNK